MSFYGVTDLWTYVLGAIGIGLIAARNPDALMMVLPADQLIQDTVAYHAVMRDALKIVQTGTAGFGLTIDLDALDPDETPAVGSPVAGGIRQAALLEALALLGAHPALLAIELVEYNPLHDKQAGILPFITDMMDTLISRRRSTSSC